MCPINGENTLSKIIETIEILKNIYLVFLELYQNEVNAKCYYC